MKIKVKKSWLIYTLLAAIVLLLAAMLLPALHTNCHPHSKWIRSSSNLKQIGLALKQYAIDYQDYFPDKPGAAGLNQLFAGEFLTDYNVFRTPYDKRNTHRNNVIDDANSSYAYVGAGLKEGDGMDPGVIPMAFDKPWFLENHTPILFMDGHVEAFIQVNAKTCVDVIEFCRKKYNPDDPAWQILLENARLVDEANPPELRPPARPKRLGSP